MAYNDLTDLIRFLGETAQEASMRAALASAQDAKALKEEAEELVTLRSQLLQRIWDVELNAQIPLPLSIQEAA